jgi:hypothetical protein
MAGGFFVFRTLLTEEITTVKNLPHKKLEYTLDDLSCQYCLYYQGKDEPCPLKICCCEDEKRKLIERMFGNVSLSS